MRQHPGTDLAQFAREHLTYEVSGAAHCAHALAAGESPSMTPVRQELLVASLAHLRLLDDFFGLEHSSFASDVLAVDYSDDWTPRRTLDGPDRDAINSQVAHLSTQRVSGRGWKVVALTSRALETVVEFGECVRGTAFERPMEPSVRAASAFVEWARPRPPSLTPTGWVVDRSQSMTTTSSEPFVVSDFTRFREGMP